jgi:hypothetical protein
MSDEDDATSTKSESAEAFGPGKLGTGSDRAIAKHAIGMWEAKNELYSQRLAQWDVNEMRRKGIKNVSVRRESGRKWIAWVPPYVHKNPYVLSAMNKSATLCRKFVSILYADPPAPKTQPDSGEDEDRDAAEFSERLLIDLMKPEKLNDLALHKRAFDRSSTFGSAYVYYTVDPTGGGKMPVTVSAGFDPGTGEKATDASDLTKNPRTLDYWPEFVERYLDEDGRVVSKVGEAATRFVPSLKGEVLTGRNVRMIPHDAQTISEARGVQLAIFPTWGTLKGLYPKLADMEDEERQLLFDFMPEQGKRIMSRDEKRHWDKKGDDHDEQPVFTLITYYKGGTEYPDGLCLVTVGDSFKAEQEKWCMDDEGVTICLPLPLAQHKQWAEGSDTPEGHGMMEITGAGNEIRSNLISQLVTHVDKINNRHIFVPTGSNINQKTRRLPGGSLIRVTPGGEPKWEDIPSFPRDGYQLLGMTTGEMENDVSLGQVAQGLESAQVQSGRHAQAIIAQAHAGLSEIVQNIASAHSRAWHIQLMLVRAFFDADQRIGWVGEDGAYKEEHWSNANLRSTGDVTVKPGTLTMLSPVTKAQFAEHLLTTGGITQEEYRELLGSNLGPMIGLQDNVYIMRVRRQIAAWDNGPPEGWQPAMGQVVDPTTGQLIQQQVMDPVLQGIFRPLTSDDFPHVALIRARELSKSQARSLYASLPQGWQWGLDQELQRAGMASSGTQGLQPGQQPAQQLSPAQRNQGPQAPPQTPVPTDNPAPEQPVQ